MKELSKLTTVIIFQIDGSLFRILAFMLDLIGTLNFVLIQLKAEVYNNSYNFLFRFF